MKRAGDLIERLFQNINHDDLKIYGKIFSAWNDIAGTDLAAHSRILEIDKGMVFVGVDHPGWMQMISMRKTRILSAIKRQYPSLEIRDLRFFLTDGVSEEELAKRFKVSQDAGPVSVQQEEPVSEEEPVEIQQPEKFKKMLDKLGKSIEKKWK